MQIVDRVNQGFEPPDRLAQIIDAAASIICTKNGESDSMFRTHRSAGSGAGKKI
jgi:hypothetical protein